MAKQCFILASPGTNIAPLARIIEEAGWTVLNRESILPTSDVYLAGIVDLIRTADALIAVLTDSKHSANTLFQLGFAAGSGRPVLLIASRRAIPTEGMLSRFPRVNATLEDTAALQLHVHAFLDNVAERPKQAYAEKPDLHRDIKPANITNIRTRTGLERRILDALVNSSEVSYLKSEYRGRSRKYIPDFALWFADEIRPLGNPVVLEVKNDNRNQRAFLNQLRQYASAADVKTAIVVQMTGASDVPQVVSPYPLTFLISLEGFLNIAREGKLVETLRRERNRFFHSVA